MMIILAVPLLVLLLAFLYWAALKDLSESHSGQTRRNRERGPRVAKPPFRVS